MPFRAAAAVRAVVLVVAAAAMPDLVLPSLDSQCQLPLGEEWTIVLKTNGDSTFGYDSPHWSSTTSTLNAGADRTLPGNAKYPEYNTRKIDAVRGCVGTLENCVEHEFAGPIGSAAALFGGEYRREGVGEGRWLEVFGPSGQRDCAAQRPGFNTQCVDGNSARW
eukprot:COSAG05_NODE_364_length_10775_cov_3.222836_15_plen_163_part_01